MVLLSSSRLMLGWYLQVGHHLLLLNSYLIAFHDNLPIYITEANRGYIVSREVRR